MRPIRKTNLPIPPLRKSPRALLFQRGVEGGFGRRTTAAAAVALTVLAVLALCGVPALAAEPAKPMMAEDTATITERNYFTNLNITAYSLTVGTMEIRADKQGPPCPGTEVGQRLETRYNNKTLFLGPENQKPECKLKVRQMAFTGPPQSR